ncbi:unnamed protein product [Spirodela intermedia]|uniref:Uncharacterized protein n=1 Tax=Spirodela intermedia TaxID=51605 RepID=A0A7I8L9C4_SPIIN|nr:unnamed protein product [Spirodela intermedia]
MVRQRAALELSNGDGLHQHGRVAELLGQVQVWVHRERPSFRVVAGAGRRGLGGGALVLPIEPRVLEGPRRVEAVERVAAEEAAGADVDGALEAVEGAHVAVEEDGVVVSVAVGGVDPFEPLRELDVADAVAAAVHHEAHPLADGLRVVDVVVAVEVEDEGPVGEDGGGPYQRVHGAGLLVMVVPRPFLP